MKEKMIKRLLMAGLVCLVIVIALNLLLLHCFDYRINMIEDLLFIVVMVGWDQYDYWRKHSDNK